MGGKVKEAQACGSELKLGFDFRGLWVWMGSDGWHASLNTPS